MENFGKGREHRAAMAMLTLNGITPVQQMVSACSGALITSVFGEYQKLYFV
jgi:hypothetical protein